MTADIDNLCDGKSVGNIRDKPLIGGYKLIDAGKKGTLKTLVDVRFYQVKNGSVVYCIVWISGGEKYGRGVGRAGGYGYDKHSAALADALSDAGVAIDSDISGRGEGAEQDAIKAIGEALGYRDTILVDFHP